MQYKQENKTAAVEPRPAPVVSGKHLARNRDDAVSVMVIEALSEGLLPHQELRMSTSNQSRGLRKGQGQGQLRQAGKARIFG